MNGWKCLLCETVIKARPNAMRHLRTMHRPLVHHRCNRCGICVRSDYDLRRHRITCVSRTSIQREIRRCTHRQSNRNYIMLPKMYHADDYLTYIKATEPNDTKRNQSIDSSPPPASEPANHEDCTSSATAVWPKEPREVSEVDGFQYFIGGHCVRVARRENDSFEVCIGLGALRREWPCPRCKLPFRTPEGLATHLRYLYDGF